MWGYTGGVSLCCFSTANLSSHRKESKATKCTHVQGGIVLLEHREGNILHRWFRFGPELIFHIAASNYWLHSSALQYAKHKWIKKPFHSDLQSEPCRWVRWKSDHPPRTLLPDRKLLSYGLSVVVWATPAAWLLRSDPPIPAKKHRFVKAFCWKHPAANENTHESCGIDPNTIVLLLYTYVHVGNLFYTCTTKWAETVTT